MGLTALGVSALKGGFSLLGNLLGFGSNQATNAANRKLMDHQYDLNLDMWNRNNAYNDPSAQMSRLQAAGLNPNLVYGSGAAGNASSMPDSVKPIPQNSYQQFGSLGVGDAIDAYIASKRLEMEQSVSNADILVKKTQAISNLIKTTIDKLGIPESKFAAEKYKYLLDQSLPGYYAEIMTQLEGVNLNTENQKLSNLQVDYINKVQEGRNLVSQGKYIDSSTEALLASAQKTREEARRIRELLPLEKKNLSAQYQLEMAKINKISSECELIAQQVENAIKDGRIKTQDELNKYLQNKLKQFEFDTRSYRFAADIFNKLGLKLPTF